MISQLLLEEEAQEVYFTDDKISTHTCAGGDIDSGYKPISVIFKDSYDFCMAKLDLYKQQIHELDEKFSGGCTIGDKLKLLCEVKCYGMLKIIVDKITSDGTVDSLVMDYCYTFLTSEYIPRCFYGCTDDIFDKFCGNPCANLKLLFSAGELKPFKIYTYHVSSQLQLCFTILDYISRRSLKLKQCEECGTFFIANHMNEIYCSDRCRYAAMNKAKARSAAKPLRQAWKKAYLRIYNRSSLSGLDPATFGFTDKKQIEKARDCIRAGDKSTLIDMLRLEMDTRIAEHVNIDAIVRWLNGVALKQKSCQSASPAPSANKTKRFVR